MFRAEWAELAPQVIALGLEGLAKGGKSTHSRGGDGHHRENVRATRLEQFPAFSALHAHLLHELVQNDVDRVNLRT